MSKLQFPDVPKHTQEAIARLRNFYRKGDRAPPTVHRQRTIENAAERSRLNKDTLRKARTLAKSKHGYDKDEWDGLIRQLEAHEDQGNGWFFGQTHVIRLISVRDRAVRKQRQDDVINGEWSCTQLDQAIRLRYGTRKSAGRRRSVPCERLALLRQIVQECDCWERWSRSLNQLNEDEQLIPLRLIPRAVKAKLSGILPDIERLRKSAQRAIDRDGKPI